VGGIVRERIRSGPGARWALAGIIGLSAVGLGACGGDNGGAGAMAAPASSSASAPAASAPAAVPADAPPAARCHKVPVGTLRLIASHASSKTKFHVTSAAAVDAGPGYAVSSVVFAGGRRMVATWAVDRLRTPTSVTSGNAQALEVTNWPLQALAADPAGQSRLCVTRNLRGPGPR
jgi:hypothetical protein